MRFYKVDGSFKIDEEDSDFGWWLCDTQQAHYMSGLQRTSNEKGFYESGELQIEQKEIEDSASLINFSKKREQVAIEKFEPGVKVQKVVSAQETQMDLEQCKCVDINTRKSTERIKENVMLESKELSTIKERLPSLVSENTFESKLLMAVINFSRYRNLITTPRLSVEISDIQIPELVNPSPFFDKPIISSKLEKLYNSSGNLYRRKQSLLKELYPTDSFEDINSLSLCVLQTKNGEVKTPEKLGCLQSECLKISATGQFKERFLECAELLYENLEELNTKVREMREELLTIRTDLQREDRRSAQVLIELQRLSEELRESNYLNDILRLLMGQAEKVKSNKWPFKICSEGDKELNLIV